jgi:hypothetical protein
MGTALLHAERRTDEWTDRQTDRQKKVHDEDNRPFSELCEKHLERKDWEENRKKEKNENNMERKQIKGRPYGATYTVIRKIPI